MSNLSAVLAMAALSTYTLIHVERQLDKDAFSLLQCLYSIIVLIFHRCSVMIYIRSRINMKPSFVSLALSQRENKITTQPAVRERNSLKLYFFSHRHDSLPQTFAPKHPIHKAASYHMSLR